MWGVTGHCGLAKQSAPQPQAGPCSESNAVSPIREFPPAREGRSWQSYSQNQTKPYISERQRSDMKETNQIRSRAPGRKLLVSVQEKPIGNKRSSRSIPFYEVINRQSVKESSLKSLRAMGTRGGTAQRAPTRRINPNRILSKEIWSQQEQHIQQKVRGRTTRRRRGRKTG